jgi:TatD DNase family protein
MFPPLIDTHCHFDHAEVLQPWLSEAAAANVTVIAIGGNATMNATAAASGTWFTQGYDWSSDPILPLPEVLPKQVGIGELGFDFHYEQGPAALARQRENFDRQADLARRTGLPIIVHTREADAATFEALKAADLPGRGVIHSYTGGIPFARQLLDLGYFISLSGIVTFRNADALRETAKFIPEDRLLVETDAPYLAPVPFRGQTNRPVNVRTTADFIAALRGLSTVDFAALTTANAKRCFPVLAEGEP